MVNLAYSRVADHKDHTISFALTFRVDYGASCWTWHSNDGGHMGEWLRS
jgi:hypothetical protein